MIAIDTETHLITRRNPAPPVVCLSYSDGKDKGLLVGKDIEIILPELLKEELVGCNVAYDFLCLANMYPQYLELIIDGYENKLYTDVNIRQQLFDIYYGRNRSDEASNYSLAFLAKLVLEVEIAGKHGDDAWRLRYSELENVPLEQWPQEAIDYAVLDADYTYRIYKEQEKVAFSMLEHHFFSYSAFCLRVIEARGMRTDKKKVTACKSHHVSELIKVRDKLLKAKILRIDKNGKYVKYGVAIKARIEDAYRSLNKPIPQTEKGNIKTDKVACLLSEDPLLMDKCKYAQHEKVLSTYIPPLEKGTSGPLTTWFKLAVTGRTTSSTPREPAFGCNLQNAPRAGGIRECFVPRPGYVFLAADFSGAELHTLAQTCYMILGYSSLGDALNSGIDAHLKVAATLANLSFDEALELYKSGCERMESLRGDAKAANFGFAGGMAEKTFILTQLNQREELWSFERAAKARQAWLNTWVEMPEYFRHIKMLIGRGGEARIKIPSTGFERYTYSFTQASNTYFQSLAAFGARAAIAETVKECLTGSLKGCYVVNFVHDELILEVPDNDELTENAQILQALMEYAFNQYVPKCPVKAEPYAMRYWSKKAKPIFKNERLIPWQ